MTAPRLLTLDIETSPHEGYFWRLFDENISLTQLKRPSRILSVGRHWLGDPLSEVRYDDVWPYTSDRRRNILLRRVHADMSKADGIITFNGARFDLPKLNGEFLLAGLEPLPPISHIDVFLTTRKLGYASNRLEYVAPLLGCGKKVKSSFELWRGYVEGDEASRDKMRRYNIRDVRVLERVFNKVRPYIKPFPRLHDRPSCPSCGSSAVHRHGFRRTEFFKIERHQCQACSKWFDGVKSKA